MAYAIMRCKKLRDDQTAFAAAVADLGLQRGIEGSRATHTRVKSFYGALKRPPVEHLTIGQEHLEPRQYKPQGMLEHLRLVKRAESTDEIAARLTRFVQDNYAPALDMAVNAQKQAEKAAEMVRTLNTLGRD